MELSKIKIYFASPSARSTVWADDKGDYLFYKKGRFCHEVKRSDIDVPKAAESAANEPETAGKTIYSNHKKNKKK